METEFCVNGMEREDLASLTDRRVAERRLAILGAGSWGTALALILADNAHRICLWARSQEHAKALQRERENRRYLPGFPLPSGIEVTSCLEEALAETEGVIFAVPSDAVRSVAESIRSLLPPSAFVLSATKGLEEGTGFRMSQVLMEVLPEVEKRLAVLSGPNLAVEMARGVPTATVVAAFHEETARHIQQVFAQQSVPTFRVYTSTDVVGVELGGAVKNAIAIGIGVCDALGYGDNARAAFMTRGLMETIRLGRAQGAKAETFSGLSGVGDLIATAHSRLSRNYRVGYGIGQGKALEEVLREIGQVAEGVPTTRVLCSLAQRYGVEMPLSQALHCLLFEGFSPEEIIRNLMLRPLKSEGTPCGME